MNRKLHVMLTGIKKDYKVCSQQNKKDKRYQTIFHYDTFPDKPRIYLGNGLIKYHTKI